MSGFLTFLTNQQILPPVREAEQQMFLQKGVVLSRKIWSASGPLYFTGLALWNPVNIIPNQGEHWGHLREFFACFIPMSKALARLTEIRISGMACSACQIDANHKILLCIFEKYGFQFRCKKANYVTLLWSSDRTSSIKNGNYTI